jgi:hypothetical protein
MARPKKCRSCSADLPDDVGWCLQCLAPIVRFAPRESLTGSFVGPLRLDARRSLRGGTETTFSLSVRLVLTTCLCLVTLGAWVLLFPTFVAIPTILVPTTALVLKVLLDVWRPVPAASTQPPKSRRPSPASSTKARSGQNQRRPKTISASGVLLTIAGTIGVAVYLLLDEQRRYPVVAAFILIGGAVVIYRVGREP